MSPSSLLVCQKQMFGAHPFSDMTLVFGILNVEAQRHGGEDLP